VTMADTSVAADLPSRRKRASLQARTRFVTFEPGRPCLLGDGDHENDGRRSWSAFSSFVCPLGPGLLRRSVPRLHAIWRRRRGRLLQRGQRASSSDSMTSE
jgi:hypothetical protein